jgi:acyl-CoA synthetase (AMP-forming)/AMP-acid ligase II
VKSYRSSPPSRTPTGSPKRTASRRSTQAKSCSGARPRRARVAPYLDCKIVNEGGEPVAAGALGEVLFYGATVTPGYWNRPEATAEAVRNGWLHTGDLGYLDDEGFLFLVDRAKDMILRGGENVYCVEIENCLAEHPSIDEAAVVGVPDAELGERVKAIVKRAPGRIDRRKRGQGPRCRAPGALQGARDRRVHRRAFAAQSGRQALEERAAQARTLSRALRSDIRLIERAAPSASRRRPRSCNFSSLPRSG